MEEIVKIEIGMALPGEYWLATAKNLEKIFPKIAERLMLINKDGRGAEDAADFMSDAMLALVAMEYVGRFAADNCRIIPI